MRLRSIRVHRIMRATCLLSIERRRCPYNLELLENAAQHGVAVDGLVGRLWPPSGARN